MTIDGGVRKLCIDFVQVNGSSNMILQRAHDIFGPSIRSIKFWLSEFRRTGTYKPTRKRTLKIVDPEHVEELFDMIFNNCTMYYSEMVSNLELAFDTTYTEAQIRLDLHKNGWSRSKIQLNAIEQNVLERAIWRETLISCFPGYYNCIPIL